MGVTTRIAFPLRAPSVSGVARAGLAAEEAGVVTTAEALARGAESARKQTLDLYREADAVPTLGTAPHPELYHRLADNRERLGRLDEAAAWRRLAGPP